MANDQVLDNGRWAELRRGCSRPKLVRRGRFSSVLSFPLPFAWMQRRTVPRGWKSRKMKEVLIPERETGFYCLWHLSLGCYLNAAQPTLTDTFFLHVPLTEGIWGLAVCQAHTSHISYPHNWYLKCYELFFFFFPPHMESKAQKGLGNWQKAACLGSGSSGKDSWDRM